MPTSTIKKKGSNGGSTNHSTLIAFRFCFTARATTILTIVAYTAFKPVETKVVVNTDRQYGGENKLDHSVHYHYHHHYWTLPPEQPPPLIPHPHFHHPRFAKYLPRWLVNSRLPYIGGVNHHHVHQHYSPPLPLPVPETTTLKPEEGSKSTTLRPPNRTNVEFLKSFIQPFLAVASGFG